MATNPAEKRIADITALIPEKDENLAQAPVYHISTVQEGTEIKSFARANAEARLPQEAVFFIIPKTDMELIGIVTRSIAQASSDDKLWDSLLTYAEVNKSRVRPEVMTREQAVAKVLRISQSKGTVVFDNTGAKLKGVYNIPQGYIFTHKPEGQAEEEDELILEPEVGEVVQSSEEQNSTMLLPEVINESPASLENTVAIMSFDANRVTPPTKTLEKKVSISLTRPLENASKIIAFIFEEDLDSKQVKEPEEKKELPGQSGQTDIQEAPAVASGASPFFGGTVNYTIADGALDSDHNN